MGKTNLDYPIFMSKYFLCLTTHLLPFLINVNTMDTKLYGLKRHYFQLIIFAVFNQNISTFI